MNTRRLISSLKPMQARVCSRTISQMKAFVPRTVPNHIHFAKRMVSERSFAEERLKEMGETLDPAPVEDAVVIDFSDIDTPNARVKRIVDEVLELNILEVNMFFKTIQKRLGVSDEFLNGSMGGGGGGGQAAAVVEEEVVVEEVVVKDIFEMKLKSFDPKAKIKIIKEVRAITGLGLKEAKDLVEKAPVIIKEGLSKADAAALEKVLVDVGAEVEIL